MLLPRLDGATVLDLCAGVGGLGLEALSRGAARVVLVDADRRAVDGLNRWIAERGVGGEAVALRRDARTGGWPAHAYDIVFVDPPFAMWDAPDDLRAVLARGVESLAPGGLLVAKMPARAAVPEDPRWRVVDRRSAGEAALALLVHPPAAGEPPPSP
jgi:16S rRNA (guanine966-N2)-methyltransferase